MAEKENLQCKQGAIERITVEEMEVAVAAGLKKVRQYGGKTYELVAIALKEDTVKCQTLAEYTQGMKIQNIPCKLEEKASVIAVYLRVA